VKRGFTLLELMIVLVMLPVVTAAIGTFYLETRIATQRIESQVALTRSVSLAHEYIARDLRGAEEVTADGDVRIRRPSETVTYAVTDGGLVRRSAGRDRVIARRVSAMRIEADGDRGWTIELDAERRFLGKRRLRMTRTMFVARRR